MNNLCLSKIYFKKVEYQGKSLIYVKIVSTLLGINFNNNFVCELRQMLAVFL